MMGFAASCGCSSGPNDRLSPLFGFPDVDIENCDLHTHGTQGFRHSAAQLAPAAGDCGNLTGKIEPLQDVVLHTV